MPPATTRSLGWRMAPTRWPRRKAASPAFTATPITFSITGTITPAASGAGSTVTLSGASAATTTADASGNYSFAGLANGAHTVAASKGGLPRVHRDADHLQHHRHDHPGRQRRGGDGHSEWRLGRDDDG